MKKLLPILAAVLLGAAGGWAACTYATVVVRSPAEVPLFAWIGYWRMGEEHSIAISVEGGDLLRIDGHATYGANDPDRIANGTVQVGAFSVRLPAGWVGDDGRIEFAVGEDGILPYAEGGEIDCGVRMALGHAVLIVSDNGRCGGANVSFIGEYRRPER